LSGKGDGEFHQRGDAGAVDLRDIIEIDDQFAGAPLHEFLRKVVQVLAGLAYGKPTVHLKVVDAVRLSGRNFEWWMKRHESSPQLI
jgi:hypothetical protein